jgi:hypothetical protein
MSATFTPYLEAQADRDPADSDAYLRVRVPDGPRPDRSILLYLPDGTGLVVNSNQLLHLDAGPSCPGGSDDHPQHPGRPRKHPVSGRPTQDKRQHGKDSS